MKLILQRRELDRRRFLKLTAGGAAWLGLGAVPACFDEQVGAPAEDGFTVWIAQSVSGTVKHNNTLDPIQGATVQFFAGFDEANLFQVASAAATNSAGGFSMVRSDETGVAGDYWWFVVPDEKPRTVYIRLEVRHPQYFTAYPRKTLSRAPSTERPTQRLDIYALSFSVVMEFASGENP